MTKIVDVSDFFPVATAQEVVSFIGSQNPQVADDETTLQAKICTLLAGGVIVSMGIAGARFTSADQSAAVASITDAPASGKKLVITDIIISSDTALRVDVSEETTGTIFESVYMGANTTVNLVTRGKFKLTTADKKLQVRTSIAGNISVTALYFSE